MAAENDTEKESSVVTKEAQVDAKDSSASNLNSDDDTAKDAKMPTKVIVRRLPPFMKENEFIDSVSPLPDHDYLKFVEADPTLIPYGLSRATINFLNEEEVYIFKQRFDGYVFVDGKGHEYQAIVEFAPNQKIPKKSRSRKDVKNGTIDEDQDFLKFAEALQNPTKSTKTIQQCLEDIDAREKELKSKEKSTPLLEYIREKADKKKLDREQRRDTRRKKEDERKKARDEDRKRRKEKKEQEIREREMRDKDKKDKSTGKSGNYKQQQKGIIDTEKGKIEKYEKSYRRDESSNEPSGTSGGRGSRGGKSSRYQNDETKYNSSKDRPAENKYENRNLKGDKNRDDRERSILKEKENDDSNNQPGENTKSESKYVSKSSLNRSKDDRRRTKEYAKDEGVPKSREERQKERDEREKERFRKREEERQRKWQEQKEERQRQKEAAASANSSSDVLNKTCDNKTNTECNNVESNLETSNDRDSDIAMRVNSSAENSQRVSSKGSKRYSDKRREDKIRKEFSDSKFESKNQSGSNLNLDEMSKDLTKMLHLESNRSDTDIQSDYKHNDRKDRGKGRHARARDSDKLERDASDNLDTEKRKNKERPALQIYKPGMGRLNYQATSKGNSSKYDHDEKNKASELESTKYSDDKQNKEEKYTNKPKGRNNRNYKSDAVIDTVDYKQHDKFQRQQYKSEARDNDSDRRFEGQMKEGKEAFKSSKTEENRKRSDGRFDYKNKAKDDRDVVRTDNASKSGAKSEGRHYTSGKDRRDAGKNFSNRPYVANQESSKEGQILPSNDSNDQIKEDLNNAADTTSADVGPPKEKERSGKSYSSKRKERQQQRKEQ